MCVHVGSRPMQALGNEACDSRRVKPKDSPSHPGQPGQGKTGRANDREPSTRLRNRKVAVTTMADTAILGQGPAPALSPANGHPGPAVEKAPAPAAPLRMRNAATPLRSGPRASKPDDLRKDGPSPAAGGRGPYNTWGSRCAERIQLGYSGTHFKPAQRQHSGNEDTGSFGMAR